ncbi:MAG: DUF1045 domain-containing protein [Pseudomonadota bacterium]
MRYALYLTPSPHHPLTRAAEAWLGRSAFGHPAGPPTAPTDVTSAARYGFHATMRAPFQLREGTTRDDLMARYTAFCRAHPGVSTRLSVQTLGSFIALMSDDNASLRALATKALHAFEPLRAPLSAAERTRRGEDWLDPRGKTLLNAWGYPYTEERFHFHMTLSGPRPAAATHTAASATFDGLLAQKIPLAFALFAEPMAGAPFDAIAFAGRPL